MATNENPIFLSPIELEKIFSYTALSDLLKLRLVNKQYQLAANNVFCSKKCEWQYNGLGERSIKDNLMSKWLVSPEKPIIDAHALNYIILQTNDDIQQNIFGLLLLNKIQDHTYHLTDDNFNSMINFMNAVKSNAREALHALRWMTSITNKKQFDSLLQLIIKRLASADDYFCRIITSIIPSLLKSAHLTQDAFNILFEAAYSSIHERFGCFSDIAIKLPVLFLQCPTIPLENFNTLINRYSDVLTVAGNKSAPYETSRKIGKLAISILPHILAAQLSQQHFSTLIDKLIGLLRVALSKDEISPILAESLTNIRFNILIKKLSDMDFSANAYAYNFFLDTLLLAKLTAGQRDVFFKEIIKLLENNHQQLSNQKLKIFPKLLRTSTLSSEQYTFLFEKICEISFGLHRIGSDENCAKEQTSITIFYLLLQKTKLSNYQFINFINCFNAIVRNNAGWSEHTYNITMMLLDDLLQNSQFTPTHLKIILDNAILTLQNESYEPAIRIIEKYKLYLDYYQLHHITECIFKIRLKNRNISAVDEKYRFLIEALPVLIDKLPLSTLQCRLIVNDVYQSLNSDEFSTLHQKALRALSSLLECAKFTKFNALLISQSCRFSSISNLPIYIDGKTLKTLRQNIEEMPQYPDWDEKPPYNFNKFLSRGYLETASFKNRIFLNGILKNNKLNQEEFNRLFNIFNDRLNDPFNWIEHYLICDVLPNILGSPKITNVQRDTVVEKICFMLSANKEVDFILQVLPRIIKASLITQQHIEKIASLLPTIAQNQQTNGDIIKKAINVLFYLFASKKITETQLGLLKENNLDMELLSIAVNIYQNQANKKRSRSVSTLSLFSNSSIQSHENSIISAPIANNFPSEKKRKI